MRSKVQVSPGVLLLLPAALLLLPIRWTLAWILAVSLHEMGHYLALRLCKIPIYALRLTPLGILMDTGQMQRRETVLCALAGPVFALLFTVLSPVMPGTAVCILFQSLYNLLPLYPLDGGRALRAVLSKLFPVRTAYYIEGIVLTVVAAVGVYVFYILKLGIIPTLLLLAIFAQKFLANR